MTATMIAERAPQQLSPIPFARLLRAEWRKTIGTRAARWLLATAAAMTMGATLIPLLFPHNVAQTRASYLSWAALGLTRLLPVVLMLAMTAEWSQRTAMTTFTQEPRRGRVLSAKIVTGLAISLAGACFAVLASQLMVAAAGAAGRHIAPGWNWAALTGCILFTLLTATIGIAFGACLHNTAAAIVTYFALGAAFNVFTVPALQKAGQWLNTGQTYGWILEGKWSGHSAQIATSTLLWAVLPLTLGLVRTLRREVR
jgi:ABC-type transport system involved in multi-copper enzyme maturation permease subunit